jgi:hypothetical protein
LGSKCRIAIASAFRPSIVEKDVLPFYVSEFLEPVLKSVEGSGGRRRTRAQDADPRDLTRLLLRLGGERRSEEATHNAFDECAPIHH